MFERHSPNRVYSAAPARPQLLQHMRLAPLGSTQGEWWYLQQFGMNTDKKEIEYNNIPLKFHKCTSDEGFFKPKASVANYTDVIMPKLECLDGA